VYLKDAPTIHRSVTQETVALSYCKVELNAAVLCAQDMINQKHMLESIRLQVELPIIIEKDNKGAANHINRFIVGEVL
jgi:hypothetical protein